MAAPSKPLRLLVIDDPNLAEIIPLEWQARMDADLVLRQKTSQEYLAAVDQPFDADVIVFPSRLLGEFVERNRIARIPDYVLKNEEYGWTDILEMTRRQELRWGKQVYALPLGSPQLVLLYRRDVFEKLKLAAPTTWNDYATLLEKLGNSSQQPSQVIETRGPGWAGQLLLARAASYARHRSHYSALFDYRSMQPLINQPPFVRALEEMAKSQVESAATPHAAAKQFFAGNAALAIAWPSRAHHIESSSATGDSISVGFAPLPGSADVYNFRESKWMTRDDDEPMGVPLMGVDGRLVAITRECKRTAAAMSMARLLTDIQWSPIIGPRSTSTTLFRDSQLKQASAWVEPLVDAEAASQYAQTIEANQSRPVVLFSVRIPGQHRYLTVLDNAVQQATLGEKEPQAALDEAARQWQAITDEYGAEAQRRAYERSLGL